MNITEIACYLKTLPKVIDIQSTTLVGFLYDLPKVEVLWVGQVIRQTNEKPDPTAQRVNP